MLFHLVSQLTMVSKQGYQIVGKSQEKQKKIQKSGINGGLKKHQILSVETYIFPYIQIPSIGKKLSENPSKSD